MAEAVSDLLDVGMLLDKKRSTRVAQSRGSGGANILAAFPGSERLDGPDAA
jgi:hypothetical protein